MKSVFRGSTVKIKDRAVKIPHFKKKNQYEGKKDVLEGLGPNEFLLVEEWAMKFLALHFREKSSEFYGKRGINWYVTAAIRKTEACVLSVDVFVHIFNNCIQNQVTVVSQDTLSTQWWYPELTKAYLRPDNTGCYHGGYLLTGLPSVGSNSGIKVIGYDFSECYGLPVRLPYIVITCAHIDSIKRVCSEPPCCPGAFLDLLSIHDNFGDENGIFRVIYCGKSERNS